MNYKKKEMPDNPPLYDEVQANNGKNSPLYLGPYGPDEYPPEKGNGSINSQSGEYNAEWKNSGPPAPNSLQLPSNFGLGGVPPNTYGVPANTYAVPAHKINIAYDTEGRSTRPGYKEYLQRDQQRVAQGDLPKPRSAFSRGAPLAPSRKGGSSGSFPGGRGATYYSSSDPK